ncbi:MAG: SIR2 family protein [Isosphaeraceae bacterium]
MTMLSGLGTGQAARVQPTDTLSGPQWRSLLNRIDEKRCTPFIGSGGCDPDLVPPPWKIAQEWSSDAECQYRLGDTTNLPQVAQYRATNEMIPSEELHRKLKHAQLANSTNDNDVHRCLAALPFPLYVCTHYFNFMTEALRERKKDPRREFCRWHQDEAMKLALGPTLMEQEPEYKPSPANPLVFHLFGLLEQPASMVLTEDDYLDFLVKTAFDSTTHSSGQVDEPAIPLAVDRAMTNPSLLFLGYRLDDLEFRVLLRKLICSRQIRNSMHITVQMVAVDDSTDAEQVHQLQDFVNKYLKYISFGVSAYPGTLNDFTTELHQRWEDFDAKAPGDR